MTEKPCRPDNLRAARLFQTAAADRRTKRWNILKKINKRRKSFPVDGEKLVF
ncbi:hypothetical protein NEIPOLOT_00308 [Neisseria polysaccharea ATCC 43768]|nr:hypothetical protein NEIPOLOT_00308 [Neisseria polysaccharea ATCC 43768]